MTTTKKCPICGRTFTPTHGNTVYCSTACQQAGAKKKLQEWKRRTGYNAKQREKMRRYREERAGEKSAREAAEDARRKVVQAEARRKAAAAYNDQLQERAAAGDPAAIMLLHNHYDAEYWQAYQARELEYNNQTRTVNGISILSDHFADDVIQSIKDTGIILAQL